MKNNKWIRFWNIQKHSAGGFTLVELIVVIAILAILAGVAVPAYSGYIKKANRAADEALLASLNTAFAAACASNGENHIGRQDVGNIGLVNGLIPADYVFANAAIDGYVDGYYEPGKFEVIERLVYDAAFGGFKDPATAADIVMAYGGGFVHVSGEAINALLNSTYYSGDMDSQTLMSQVDRVAGIAGGMATVTNVTETPSYVNAALTALGITPGPDHEANKALLNKTAVGLAFKELGLEGDNIYDLPNEKKEEFGKIMDRINNTSLVLYTAKNTQNMTVEEAKGLLNGITSDAIKNAMNNGQNDAEKAQGMNQAALAYGMYYAYVNSAVGPQGMTQEQKQNVTAQQVIDALDKDQNFKDYIGSPQGTKDMEAYLQALKVVNSSTQDPEAVKQLAVNGFMDPELLGILQGTMGK